MTNTPLALYIDKHIFTSPLWLLCCVYFVSYWGRCIESKNVKSQHKTKSVELLSWFCHHSSHDLEQLQYLRPTAWCWLRLVKDRFKTLRYFFSLQKLINVFSLHTRFDLDSLLTKVVRFSRSSDWDKLKWRVCIILHLNLTSAVNSYF